MLSFDFIVVIVNCVTRRLYTCIPVYLYCSEYMAPEMLTRSGYGPAVDWWALGALCYEMMVGQAPFTSKNQKELDRKILSDKVSLPSYLTAASHSLLKGLLDKDPSTRLGCRKGTMFFIGGMSQLKQHEFFLGIDWGELFHMKIPPPIRPEVGGEQGLACFSEGRQIVVRHIDTHPSAAGSWYCSSILA